MSNVKELKSIDLSSFTTIATGISVVFSIIVSLLVVVAIAITSPDSFGVSVYIVPTIIVGAFICGIYNYFSNGLFYNLLAKKLKTIQFELKDEKEIVKISTSETATMMAIITAIQVILLYLVSSFILPIVLNATIQTLMMAGQQGVAYGLYQLLILLNQPVTIALIIFGSFIITFVFVLLGTYIYNIIASNGRGIIVNFSKENEMSVVDSIDELKFAIAFAIVEGILSIIFAIIMLISGGNIATTFGNIIYGFVGGFIEAYLVAMLYNYLSPKLGKLKIELIDQ